MSDFEMLKGLQKELIDTLQKRKKADFYSRDVCKTKVRRLRLQIQEVMLRIERTLDTGNRYRKEEWE